MKRFFEGFIALGLITLFFSMPWLLIVPILGGLFYLFTSKNE